MKNINIVLSSAIFLVLSACEQQNASEAAATPSGPPPAQVTTMMAEFQDVPVSFEYVGQVAGSNEAEVRARVNGIITQRLFEEGSVVERGQPLFLIDAAPYEAQLAQTEATLTSAEAAKNSARVQLKKAERDYRRVAPLSKKNLLSQNELDDAESSVELAKAALRQSEAAILQAQASIKTAQINLDYTEIAAPIAGVVGRSHKMEGSLAEVGSNSLLTTIAQTNPAFINFGVAETDQLQRQQDIDSGALLLSESGFTVVVKTTIGMQLEQTGKVNFQDYRVDALTGSFSMRAQIENAAGTLSPGQFVRVELQGAKRSNAILLPQRAVLDSPQGKYVYVVGQGAEGGSVAEFRPVGVGEWVQLDGALKNAWIVKSGLNQGDQVVVEGMARIFYPGMPIQVSPPQAMQSAPETSVETAPATTH